MGGGNQADNHTKSPIDDDVDVDDAADDDAIDPSSHLGCVYFYKSCVLFLFPPSFLFFNFFSLLLLYFLFLKKYIYIFWNYF